jgi:hypothetical protein
MSGYAMIEISCSVFALSAMIVIATTSAGGTISLARNTLPRYAYTNAMISTPTKKAREKIVNSILLEVIYKITIDSKVAINENTKIFRVSRRKDGSLSSGSLK